MRLLPLLLMFAAAPARAFDENQLVSALKTDAAMLSGFDEEKARLKVVQVVVGQPKGGPNGQYDSLQLRVILNKDKIAVSESMLDGCKAGMTTEEVLAVHLLPALMHELRHSHNDTIIGDKTSSLEEEVSAFITQMGAYRQGLSLWPQAYKCDSWFRVQDYRVDAILWKPSGVKGLESAVKTAYGNPCSVASDRDACRALALQRFERVQKLRAQIESQGPSTDTTCAQACQLLRSQLGDDSCTDKETAMRLIWDASIAKMYWNSDAKMAKAKDYYLNVEYPRGNALWNAQK